MMKKIILLIVILLPLIAFVFYINDLPPNPQSCSSQELLGYTAPQTPEKVVMDLLKVISRELPFCVTSDLLDDNVNAYMDGDLLSTGSKAWFQWVRYLQHTADETISDLKIVVDDVRTQGDMITVGARWSGVVDGEVIFSVPGEVIYQVKNKKVVNIWTTRRNYTFIHGDSITSTPGFYWTVLKMLSWRP